MIESNRLIILKKFRPFSLINFHKNPNEYELKKFPIKITNILKNEANFELLKINKYPDIYTSVEQEQFLIETF